MTYQELQRIIPDGKLHSGKDKKPEERNAYENIAMLYSGLNAYSKALKSANIEVPEEVTNIMKTTRILGKALGKNTQDVPGKDLNDAEGSIGNGVLEQQMSSLLEKLQNGQAVADDKVKANLTELLQRCGASLEMKGLDIPEQYRTDARLVNDSIKLTKIESARKEEEEIAKRTENKQPKENIQDQADQEKIEQQDAKIQDIWDYEEGESPTARAYIDALRRKIGSPAFLNMKKDDQNKLLMGVLAARMAVNAVRNKGASLDVPLTKEAFREAYDQVSASPYMKNLLANHTANHLQERMMQPGHGGVFMDDIKNELNRMTEIDPKFVPQYFMPTALERTAYYINDIKASDEISNDDLYTDIKAIFAARMAVEAKRNQKDTLSVKPDPYDLENAMKQVKNDGNLREFVENNREALIALSKERGHGGAMEDLYRKHLAAMPTLPTNVPRHLMPTVHERVQALQDKIDSREFRNLSPDQQKEVYKELFIARSAGNVAQQSKADTKTHIGGKSYEIAAKELRNNRKLDQWLDTVIADGNARKYAMKGHAGLLERRFMGAMSRERYEPDVPARYKRGQYIRPEEKQQEVEIDLDKKQPVKNNLQMSAEPGNIRDLLKENYITNGKWDEDDLKKDEEVIRYQAAKAMYVSMVLTNAHNRKDGQAYIGKMENGDLAEEKIQEFMKSEAFDNMFKKHGVAGMAQMTYKGGARVAEAYMKEKDLLQVNAIKEEDEEYIEEDEKLVEKEDEKIKGSGEVININAL